uniref:ubiquitinyl hydrolase 1 n=1 Tax=Sipha flava TaxID=143950 RepID=A0A2S2QZN8_9HEMI
METSEVDTSILTPLHSNRYDYLRADDKDNFGDSAFLAENLDKELPKTLPELSEITDSDTYLHNNEPSQMMTVDSSWTEDSTSCFPTSTNSSFPIALPGPSDFDEFSGLQSDSRAETPGLGLNSIFTADADLSDPTAEIGVCGLRNLGNTCFMSAGLQALLSTESLVTYFLNFDTDGSEDTLIGQFSDLAKRFWHGQFSIINPHQFKYVLGKRYAQFRDCSQHDCQEFLALLLDSLNDELLMHISKHCKIITSRKTRKSPNPRKLLPRDVDEFVISSSDYELPQTICEILTEKLSENQDLLEKIADNSDSDVHVSPIDSTISSCESDSHKTKVKITDLLNGKREICCDSSSDLKLMDLKRVKLDDAKLNKTELVEADSLGSTVENRTQQESIINRIFQGQFESTVTCLECNYVSVMHEPFMYLSVPLPFATQQQMYVTFVSATNKPPIKYLITVNKQDDIKKVKNELVALIGEDKCSDMLVVAEVFNKHISKILSDDYLVRSVDYNNRDLYAFEVLEINVDLMNGDKETCTEGDAHIEPMDVDSGTVEQGETCTICLECKPDMLHHKDIKDCTCVLCEECIKMSCVHSSGEKDRIDCPVCRVKIDPKIDLIPIDQPANSINQTIRRLTIPIVIKQMDDKGLIGRPALIRLPSEVPAEILYIEVAKLHPYSEDFSLSLVDGQGTMCSRCMWDSHCTGCVIPKSSMVKFRSGDTLAVMFEENIDINLLETELHPGSTEEMRSNKPLTIYDCINAFCQSELLDDNNPWWCPFCQKNQCATKTLSISKYPRCLIVYLKRFVFHENWGIKLQDSVVFPIDGLILDMKQEVVYDLYACVCHTGSTSMGHYTSYTKHIESEDWYYYNDETATKTIPGQEDYCNAYILFYKKQGKL